MSYSRPHRCLFVETLYLWTARFQKTSSSLQDCTDCFRNDQRDTCLFSSLACLALLKRDSHGACENRDIKLEGIFKSVQQMPFISSTWWFQPVWNILVYISQIGSFPIPNNKSIQIFETDHLVIFPPIFWTLVVPSLLKRCKTSTKAFLSAGEPSSTACCGFPSGPPR